MQDKNNISVREIIKICPAPTLFSLKLALGADPTFFQRVMVQVEGEGVLLGAGLLHGLQ